MKRIISSIAGVASFGMAFYLHFVAKQNAVDATFGLGGAPYFFLALLFGLFGIILSWWAVYTKS